MGTTKWQEEEKEKEREPEELSQEPPRLDFSSQSEESLVTSRREDTPRELVLVPQSTSQPFLNTSQLRSSSSQATPPRITRNQELCQDTSNSLSATMRSSPSFSERPPSPPVVFSPTSTSSSSPRQRHER